MCRATLGVTPVWRCTCAASASFSYGFRGRPGCGKTLNRVPEFPKAQDGSSIFWPRSVFVIMCMSISDVPTSAVAQPRWDYPTAPLETLHPGGPLGQRHHTVQVAVIDNGAFGDRRAQEPGKLTVGAARSRPGTMEKGFELMA